MRRFKLVPTILAVLGLTFTLMLGAVAWQFFSIRTAQQVYLKRIDDLVAKGHVVDEAGVKRLHAQRSMPDLKTLMPIGGKPFGYRVSEDKNTAALWGFSIVAREFVTPDEPPQVENENSDDSRWLWKL